MGNLFNCCHPSDIDSVPFDSNQLQGTRTPTSSVVALNLGSNNSCPDALAQPKKKRLRYQLHIDEDEDLLKA